MAGPTLNPLSEHLEQHRSLIEERLRKETQYGEGCPAELKEAIQHSLLAGGKRLRPLLVLLACEACGGRAEDALPAASAVEMIHTYSLIHDDLPAMDDDDLRRGQPSCHAKFGEGNAILAGDALLAQAFEVLGGEIEPKRVAAQCCVELAKAAGATSLVGGQFDDLSAEFSAGTLNDLEAIHHRKTGALLRVSLRLGALVAEAPSFLVDALDQFGANLGLAFQITDDLLDLQGDEATIGKTTGKDAKSGKLTYPALLGADLSVERAQRLIDEAIGHLQPLGAMANNLTSIARFVLERNR